MSVLSHIRTMQVETWHTRRRQIRLWAFSGQGTTTANFFYDMALTRCQLEYNPQQADHHTYTQNIISSKKPREIFPYSYVTIKPNNSIPRNPLYNFWLQTDINLQLTEIKIIEKVWKLFIHCRLKLFHFQYQTIGTRLHGTSHEAVKIRLKAHFQYIMLRIVAWIPMKDCVIDVTKEQRSTGQTNWYLAVKYKTKFFTMQFHQSITKKLSSFTLWSTPTNQNSIRIQRQHFNIPLS